MIRHPSLSVLLGINAGFVDTLGFLALQGLFTAHVTGNFVTIAASLVTGHAGLIAKLLALPVFLLVVALCALLEARWKARGVSLRNLLVVQLALLVATALLAMLFGPFGDVDQPWAVATGLVGVAAMAVQNALGRLHLGHLPPSTLMTGNSTQIALDLVGIGLGSAAVSPERLRSFVLGVAAFALGCALATLAFVTLHMGAFVPPVLLIAAAALHWQARPTTQT